MDSIKKKMEKLASETAEAEYRIAHFEELKVKIRKNYLFTKKGTELKTLECDILNLDLLINLEIKFMRRTSHI